MQGKPTAAELVRAVRDFLETQAMPALDGRKAFHARVAVNALAIVERELESGRVACAAEHARLQALLGRDGSLAELNRELCRRIRAGEIDPGAAGVRAHLWETTLATVAIDQPKYATYRRARDEEEG
jgi:Domain of unknown function (DUF6285)